MADPVSAAAIASSVAATGASVYGATQMGGQSGGAVTTPAWTPKQKRVAGRLAPYLTQRVGQAMPAYPGEFVAGLSPMEQAGLGQAEQFFGQTPALYGERLPSLQTALAGKPLYDISPEETERYFQQRVATPAIQQFREDILPSIGETFAGMPGAYWSSARMGAEREAGEELQRGLTETRAELTYRDIERQRQAQDAALARALGAQPAAAAYGMEPLQLAQQQIGMGALPRSIEQATMQAEYQEWMRTQPEMSPVINQALTYLGLTGLAGGMQQGVASQWPLALALGMQAIPQMGQALGQFYNPGVSSWTGGGTTAGSATTPAMDLPQLGGK